jgi:hypothetical protein
MHAERQHPQPVSLYDDTPNLPRPLRAAHTRSSCMKRAAKQSHRLTLNGGLKDFDTEVEGPERQVPVTRQMDVNKSGTRFTGPEDKPLQLHLRCQFQQLLSAPAQRGW